MTTKGAAANPVWESPTALTVPDATTTTKGIASFSSGNFAVSTGAVTIKSGGVGPTELVATAVTAGSYTLGNFTVDADGRLTAASSTGAITTSMITNNAITHGASAYSSTGTTLTNTTETVIGTITVTVNGTDDDIYLVGSAAITTAGINLGKSTIPMPIIFRIRRTNVSGTVLDSATSTGHDSVNGDQTPITLSSLDSPSAASSQVYVLTAKCYLTPDYVSAVINYKRLWGLARSK